MNSTLKSVTLQSFNLFRKQLESSLVDVDVEKLAEELFKCGTISPECRNKFCKLDLAHLESGIKVRFLLMHVQDIVKNDVRALEKFYRCLSEKFMLQKFLSNFYCAASKVQEGMKISEANAVGCILTTIDASELTELLHNVAPKWENIGIALKLSHTILQNCTSRNNITATLNNVLHEWLEGSQETCKLDTLVEALKSPIVGCVKTAQYLDEEFSKRVQIKKLESFPAHEAENTQYGFDYWSSDTEVAEGKSTLLEAQGTCGDMMVWRWSKNGHFFLNNEDYSQSHTNILLINDAGLVHQGSYKCHIMSTDKTELTTSYPVDLKVLFSAERQFLMSLYSCEPEVPANSWPPVSTMKYINLVIVNNWGKCNPCYRYSVRGDMDDVRSNKEQTQYQTEFGKFHEKSLLLVEGRPGSGKTTLVHRVCKDWAMKGNVLKHAKLVIFISLRVLSDADKQLSDILCKLFYRDQRQMKELDSMLNKITKCNGNNICFILDGLDEYDLLSRQDTVIYQLIHKKYLPESMVIVSSRPVATADLKKNLMIQKKIEVLGFSREQIVDYIKQYQFQDSSNNNVSKQLLNYLLAHSNVFHMCYLPVHAVMVCFLYDQLGDEIPHTEGKIYEKFTLLTILRYLKRQNRDNSMTSLKHLEGEILESFRRICKHAFELTISAKQVISGEDMSKSTDAPTLGLVTLDKMAGIYGMKNVYAYHHLTFQEYLAACYVDGLNDEYDGEVENKQMKLIKLHSHKPHMKMVWKFYCGTVNFEKKISQFELIASQNSDSLYAVHCAFESQQKEICDCAIQSGSSGVLSFRDHVLARYDVKAIVYVINMATHHLITRLQFEKCIFHEIEPFELDLYPDKLRLVQSLSIREHMYSQSRIFNALLRKVPYLRELDMTDTPIDIQVLTKDVKLNNLDTIRISLFSIFIEFCFSKTLMELLKFGSSKILDVSLFLVPHSEELFESGYYHHQYRQRCTVSVHSIVCDVFGFSAFLAGALPEICLCNANINWVDFNTVVPKHFCRCTVLSLLDCNINASMTKRRKSWQEVYVILRN